MKNWIETYQLENGDFDISDVNKELVSQIPVSNTDGESISAIDC